MPAPQRKRPRQRAHVRLAEGASDVRRCFPVMKQLRPRLVEAEFVEQVRRQHESGGYRLAFVEEGRRVRSVAGFRILQNFYYGKFMYVDDLVTDEAAQGRGYGSLLFDWLARLARREGCLNLALDSGVQRFNAHRFYLGKGMNIVCHHFALPLK